MKRFIPFLPKPAFVPVIRLSGTIGSGARSLSDQALAPLIERAWAMGKRVYLPVLLPHGDNRLWFAC